jgi:hypothetical protein
MRCVLDDLHAQLQRDFRLIQVVREKQTFHAPGYIRPLTFFSTTQLHKRLVYMYYVDYRLEPVYSTCGCAYPARALIRGKVPLLVKQEASFMNAIIHSSSP